MAKFVLVNFEDGFNVVYGKWMYQNGDDDLFCKWPGKKSQEEHEKIVKKEITPEDDWEGKLVTEVIGQFDTFGEARLKFRRAEKGDNLDSEPDGKRISKPNLKYITASSDEGEPEGEKSMSKGKVDRLKPINTAALSPAPPPPSSLLNKSGPLDSFLKRSSAGTSSGGTSPPSIVTARTEAPGKEAGSSTGDGEKSIGRKKPTLMATGIRNKNKKATIAAEMKKETAAAKMKEATVEAKKMKATEAAEKKKAAEAAEKKKATVAAEKKKAAEAAQKKKATLAAEKEKAAVPAGKQKATLDEEKTTTSEETSAEEVQTAQTGNMGFDQLTDEHHASGGQGAKSPATSQSPVVRRSRSVSPGTADAQNAGKRLKTTHDNASVNGSEIPVHRGHSLASCTRNGIRADDSNGVFPSEFDIDFMDDAVGDKAKACGGFPFKVNPDIFTDETEFRKFVVREHLLTRRAIRRIKVNSVVPGGAQLAPPARVDWEDDDEDDQLISEVSELKEFNNRLKDKAFFQKKVSVLSRIGGANLDKTVRAVMTAFISCTVGAQYSYEGAKKKYAFKDLKQVVRLIQASVSATKVKNAFPYHDSTVDDMLWSIREWLRQQIGKNKRLKTSTASGLADKNQKKGDENDADTSESDSSAGGEDRRSSPVNGSIDEGRHSPTTDEEFPTQSQQKRQQHPLLSDSDGGDN